MCERWKAPGARFWRLRQRRRWDLTFSWSVQQQQTRTGNRNCTRVPVRVLSGHGKPGKPWNVIQMFYPALGMVLEKCKNPKCCERHESGSESVFYMLVVGLFFFSPHIRCTMLSASVSGTLNSAHIRTVRISNLVGLCQWCGPCKAQMSYSLFGPRTPLTLLILVTLQSKVCTLSYSYFF